ncbi:MAG: hypothetical protein HOQ07_07000 [Sinomonas sp.]|nr:hypothetical protein [Sinomonas sp.]
MVRSDGLERAVAFDGRRQSIDIAEVGVVGAPNLDRAGRALELDVPGTADQGLPSRGGEGNPGQQGVVSQEIAKRFADEEPQRNAPSRGSVGQVRIRVAEHGGEHRQQPAPGDVQQPSGVEEGALGVQR